MPDIGDGKDGEEGGGDDEGDVNKTDGKSNNEADG